MYSSKLKTMKIAQDLMYATKVWLFSVFTSPILILSAYIIFDSSSGGSFSDAFGFLGVYAVFGLIFSIPSWILFMIGVRYQKHIETDTPKMNIQVIAIILCALPFLFLFGGIFGNPEVMLLAIPYLITLSIGIWYFELKPKQNETLTIDHLVE